MGGLVRGALREKRLIGQESAERTILVVAEREHELVKGLGILFQGKASAFCAGGEAKVG